MPALIVLVGSQPAALRRTQAVLSQAGHLVATTPPVADAGKLLDSIIPDLLVVDVSSDTATELRFATRSRSERPDLPVIITHAVPDADIEAEALRHGAELVVAPLQNPEFLRLVQSLLGAHRRMRVPARRWRRKHVTAPLDVDAGNARARISDVSYGGARLTFPSRPDLPSAFDITVSGANLTVRAHRVWMGNAVDGQCWCGVELEEAAAPGWCRFVDLVEPGRAV